MPLAERLLVGVRGEIGCDGEFLDSTGADVRVSEFLHSNTELRYRVY